MNTNTKNITLGVVALAVIGFVALQFGGNPESQKEVTMTTEEVTQEVVQDVTEKEEVIEKTHDDEDLADGVYEATGAYTSPAGEETLGVSVTLEDGVVIAAEVEPQATHQVSLKLQNLFKDGFADEVVGKDITEVELDKVNGSSLTPEGFNDAIQQIIKEAAA